MLCFLWMSTLLLHSPLLVFQPVPRLHVFCLSHTLCFAGSSIAIPMLLFQKVLSALGLERQTKIAGNDFCATSACPGANQRSCEVGEPALQHGRRGGLESVPQQCGSSKQTITFNVIQILSSDFYPPDEPPHFGRGYTVANLWCVSVIRACGPSSFVLYSWHLSAGQNTLLSPSTLTLPLQIPRKQGHLYHQGQKIGQFPQEDVVTLIFFTAW